MRAWIAFLAFRALAAAFFALVPIQTCQTYGQIGRDVARWGMVERNEVSRHEVEVFRVLRLHVNEWRTNKELAAECKDVAERTVRATTQKLVHLGILDQAEVFPAHRFKLAAKADKRNRGYVDRLLKAAEVFGVNV